MNIINDRVLNNLAAPFCITNDFFILVNLCVTNRETKDDLPPQF